MARKIVIENAVLRGSHDERFDQRVAIVYENDKDEFHVMAPPKATGNALEWGEHFSVRQIGDPITREEVLQRLKEDDIVDDNMKRITNLVGQETAK